MCISITEIGLRQNLPQFTTFVPGMIGNPRIPGVPDGAAHAPAVRFVIEKVPQFGLLDTVDSEF